MRFDYVVVGAGSAGCVMANRLSEDGAATVLLLEAGVWDRDPLIHVPLGIGKIFTQRLHDWGYFTEPEPHLNDRRIECARGKIVGGSSSINAMAYVRGHASDYDRWRQLGCTGWAYADVLPYFRRSESFEGDADNYRGSDGPLTVRTSTQSDPLIDAVARAMAQAGHPQARDYNGAEQHGYARWQQTIRAGRRCSAAVSYLRPALRRKNLRVETGALVIRLVVEGQRAKALYYLQAGQELRVDVDSEIVLCGGVINSPQLLMLSGIGAAQALRAQGIEPICDLPGVGENLQDHFSTVVEYSRRSPGPLEAQLRYDRLVFNMLRAYLAGTGPATDLPLPFTAFLKTHAQLEMPDIQIMLRNSPPLARPWFPPVRRAVADGMALRPVLLRPHSRGFLRLRSARPGDSVRIFQNFLAKEADVQLIRAGTELARDIGHQDALRSFGIEEIGPGRHIRSNADIDAYIRANAATAHHPVGTCKMGIDDAAVVDPQLAVRGIERLRVVDASVMPDLVGGNINAPVMMIAERAADLIRGAQSLPRAEFGVDSASAPIANRPTVEPL